MKVLSLLAVTFLVAMSGVSARAETVPAFGYGKTYCSLSIPVDDMYWMDEVVVSDVPFQMSALKPGAAAVLTKSGDDYKLFVRDTQGRSDELVFRTNISTTLTNTRTGVSCFVR